MESDGQMRTSLYDKRNDFNFHITNFPFLSSNFPSSPAYGVFISQLIRYARAFSSYECFFLRAARLSSKLEIVPQEVLWSIWGSHQTLWRSPLPNVTWHSWDMTIYNDTLNWSDITPICLTLMPNVRGFHGTLQRVRIANRGRLLLRTPGPVPYGTCICSNVETILSWICHVYGPFEFRTSLGTSFFFFLLIYIGYLHDKYQLSTTYYWWKHISTEWMTKYIPSSGNAKVKVTVKGDSWWNVMKIFTQATYHTWIIKID